MCLHLSEDLKKSRGQFHEAKTQSKTLPSRIYLNLNWNFSLCFKAERMFPLKLRGNTHSTLSHEIAPWTSTPSTSHQPEMSSILTYNFLKGQFDYQLIFNPWFVNIYETSPRCKPTNGNILLQNFWWNRICNFLRSWNNLGFAKNWKRLLDNNCYKTLALTHTNCCCCHWCYELKAKWPIVKRFWS